MTPIEAQRAPLTSDAFTRWQNRVDEILDAHLGLVADELPDHDWRADFNSALPPEEAARLFLCHFINNLDGYTPIDWN